MDTLIEIGSLMGVWILASLVLAIFAVRKNISGSLFPEDVMALVRTAGSGVTGQSFDPNRGFVFEGKNRLGAQLGALVRRESRLAWHWTLGVPWKKIRTSWVDPRLFRGWNPALPKPERLDELVVRALERALAGRGMEVGWRESVDVHVGCALTPRADDEAVTCFVIELRDPHSGRPWWRAVASPVGRGFIDGDGSLLVDEVVARIVPMLQELPPAEPELREDEDEAPGRS